MEAIDMSDRELMKSSLAATLVKDGDHLAVFSTAFEVYFATRSLESLDDLLDELSGDEESQGASGATGPGQSRGEGGGASSSMSAQELTDLLFRALRDQNRDAMRLAASEAVTRYAGMEPGRPVGGTYYLYRTLRNLELDALEQRLSESMGQGSSDDALVERLSHDEAHARIESLKAEIEREIRERLVEDRGAEALAKSVRKPLPEDLDVMHANRDEMAQLERALESQVSRSSRSSTSSTSPWPRGLATHRSSQSFDRRRAHRPAI